MTKPILYSFRRCPYAIRARIAFISHGIDFELREVDLKNKPAHMLDLSPKGTVPVLLLEDGRIIDESLDILDYVLDYKYDENTEQLIDDLNNTFIPALRCFKYPERYPEANIDHQEEIILKYLKSLDMLLTNSIHLIGDVRGKADIAILPFVRQLHRADEKWFEALNLEHLKQWYYDFYNSELHQCVMAKS